MALLVATLVTSAAAAEPAVSAPWSCEETYEVSQSHQTGSHTGKGEYSWDFAMPVGTPLVAPVEGTVRKVKQDSTRHGCDSEYAYDANYVVLTLDDDTEVLFLHLEADSVPVEEGERVARGELIGRVGMSGWTCGPHLHMQVQKTCDSWWCESVPAKLQEASTLSTGDDVTARTCDPSDDGADSQMASDQPTDDDTSRDDEATGGGD
ncbi:MAG: M23 family metallopeptidase [Persicimonas sp.]